MTGMDRLDHDAYIDAIERESAVFVAVAAALESDARVPSCPDWTVDDLLRHVGIVQRWATGQVAERRTERVWTDDVEIPADRDALLDWVRDASAGLVAVLRATPPDTAMWTFPGMGEARFWSRRQAQEIALQEVLALNMIKQTEQNSRNRKKKNMIFITKRKRNGKRIIQMYFSIKKLELIRQHL